MVRVKSVQGGSIAEELGIVPGTELVSVNGRELADFLDWEFLTADDELVIEAKLPDGDEIVYEIERPHGGGEVRQREGGGGGGGGGGGPGPPTAPPPADPGGFLF